MERKLVNTPVDGNKIYWAEVDGMKIAGKKRDVTADALTAVASHLYYSDEFTNNGRAFYSIGMSDGESRIALGVYDPAKYKLVGINEG